MAIIVLICYMCIAICVIFTFLHGENNTYAAESIFTISLHITKLKIYNEKGSLAVVCLYIQNFCKLR